MPRTAPRPPIAQKNLDAVARFEQPLMLHRSWIERLGDSISHFFGSVWFVVVQAILIGGWVEWDLPHVPLPGRLADRVIFDSYPYPLLALGVDIELSCSPRSWRCTRSTRAVAKSTGPTCRCNVAVAADRDPNESD